MAIQLEAVTQTKYLSRYANLSAALVDIGVAPTQLRVNSGTVSVTSLTTLPSTIQVELEGNSKFNIASGQTLTINHLLDPGNRQVATGTGTLIIKGTKELNISWWTGLGATTLTSTMWDGIKASVVANGGSNVIVPPGIYSTVGGLEAVTGMVFRGSGGDPDATSGAIFKLTSNSTHIFHVGHNTRDIYFEHVTFDCGTTTGSTAIDISGDTAIGVAYMIGFTNCRFHNGDYGVKVYGNPTLGWQASGLVWNQCYFLYQAIAGFYSHTSNTDYSFNTCSFNPYPNGTSIGALLDYSGTTKFKTCTFNGVNINPPALHSVIAAIDTTGGLTHDLITTATPHGITVGGSLEPVTILNPTPANLPGGYADKELLYFKAISTTTGYAYRMPKDAYSASESSLRKDFTSAGTGTHTLRTTVPITAGRPLAAIKVSNTMYALSIDNCQDEGFPFSLIVENTYESIRSIFISNSLMQGILQLNSGCHIVSIANYYLARAFKDYSSSIDTTRNYVFSYGDNAYYDYASAGYIDKGGTVQPTPVSLSGFVGNSVFRTFDTRDSGHIINSATKIQLRHQFQEYFGPILRAFRDRRPAVETQPVPLIMQGLTDTWEEEATKWYATYYIDNVPTPAYPWMEGFLESKSNPDEAYSRQGHFLRGHFATRGRNVNVLQTALTSSSNITVLNCALGDVFYFAGDIGENTVFYATNIEQTQHIDVFIPATTTSRQVNWNGGGILSRGSSALLTGTIPGMWHAKLTSLGSTLYLDEVTFTSAGGPSPDSQYPWTSSSTSQQMIINTGYLADNGALSTLTLPSQAYVGAIVKVKGMNTGGWRIAQNAGQQIIWKQGAVVGTDKTTLGTSGRLDSQDGYDYVELICIIANTTWSPLAVKGNITVT